MVRGLGLFLQHFSAFSDQYVLIGGAACDLAFDRAGASFRVTKDLDIVLCVEALTRPFADALWSFVRAGGYHEAVDLRALGLAKRQKTDVLSFLHTIYGV